MAVMLYVLDKVWGQVDDEIKSKAQRKLSKWFDDDELDIPKDLFSEDTTDAPV